MGRRKNILFSSTRQWNPGDEFILFGILNVFQSLDFQLNPIIYNRNPEIRHKESDSSFDFQCNLGKLKFKRLRSGDYDNSYKDKFINEKFIDLAVFAGTPEWASSRLKEMYKYIHKHSIPVMYLGIGIGCNDFDLGNLEPLFKEVIENAQLITVRDKSAGERLAALQPVCLPCPALLSASEQYEKKLSDVKKIGLIYASNKAVKNNKINTRTYDFMIALYRNLIKKYAQKFQFEFVSHYIDELPELSGGFGDYNLHYSYNASDYVGIYNNFDFVIGPRVHGIGVASSMGIPGINISHDVRGQTCDGFGATIIDDNYVLDEALTIIDQQINAVSELNRKLLDNKHNTFLQYQELLRPVLSALP